MRDRQADRGYWFCFRWGKKRDACVLFTWKQAWREMRGGEIVVLVEGKLRVSAGFRKSDFTVVKHFCAALNWMSDQF